MNYNIEDAIIFGEKIALLEETGRLTFTTHMDVDVRLKKLFEQLVEEFNNNTRHNYFSSFVTSRLLELEQTKKLQEEKLENYLLHKRFSETKELEKAIIEFFRGEGSVEIYEHEVLEEMDFMKSCTWHKNEEKNEYVDFDVYYLLTRNNEIYVTEVNLNEISK